MAVAVSAVISNFDTYVGDTSNDRISAAERLQLITEATVWLQEELGNDHMVKTYSLSYFDNVHTYKITTAVASLLEGADLRRGTDDQYETFAHKSSREFAEEIGQKATESSWAIERHDSDWYLVVNHQSKYPYHRIASFSSLTADGGTWSLDTVSSDATNLTVDEVEFTEGSACLNFDIDVSQSAFNRATIYNDSVTVQDLSSYEDLASFVFKVYIPDVTHFSSVTMYWGDSSSVYWYATATTDVNGNAFAAGWNTVKIPWSAATLVGNPDSSSVTAFAFDFNYTASQADDTDFRLDDLTVVRPETLTFYYTSWYVGTNSTGTSLSAFSATSDVPFYSGQYDQYKYAVAHKAASLAFYGPLRDKEEASVQEVEAIRALNRQKKLIPASTTKELKSFKVRGINFTRRR